MLRFNLLILLGGCHNICLWSTEFATNCLAICHHSLALGSSHIQIFKKSDKCKTIAFSSFETSMENSCSDKQPRSHLQPLATTCSHLQPLAATCSHLQPLAATCSHLQPLAASCPSSHLQPLAATCSYLQPLAATCPSSHLQPLAPQPQAATSSHKQPQAATSSHKQLQAATSSHLPPLAQAATCSHLQPLAATCSHLQPPAATCSHLQPLAATCSHLQPLAATCSHWQVAASGCFFENQIAHLLRPQCFKKPSFFFRLWRRDPFLEQVLARRSFCLANVILLASASWCLQIALGWLRQSCYCARSSMMFHGLLQLTACKSY